MNRRFRINNKLLVGILLVSLAAFSVRAYFAGGYEKILNISGILNDSDMSNQKVIKDEEYNLDGIKKIYANVGARVIVSYSENDKVRVVVYKNPQDKDNEDIEIEKQNDQFNIIDRSAKNSFKIHLLSNDYRPTVKLYIPKKYSNDIELKTRAGGIEYKGVRANNLKMESSAGKIKGENIEAKNIELESSAGSIEIDGFKGNLKSESSAGSTKIKCRELVGDINIESSAGGIKLYIPEKSDFRLNAETTAGSIDNDFEEGMSQKSEAAHDFVTGKVGSGKYNIELDSSAGGIDILKTK